MRWLDGITNSQSLLKLMSIESVIPSNHLILCHPLLLPPSIIPSIRVFSNESVLRIRWPQYLSFSFNISPSNEHSGLISSRMDFGRVYTQGMELLDPIVTPFEELPVFLNQQYHLMFSQQMSVYRSFRQLNFQGKLPQQKTFSQVKFHLEFCKLQHNIQFIV